MPEELVLVPSERHVDEEAARGARAMTLERFTTKLARATRPELAATTPEATRLLTARLMGERAAVAVTLDDAIGRLRQSGARATDIPDSAGVHAQRLARAMTDADAWLARVALTDQRADAWLAAEGLERAHVPELERVSGVRVRGLTRWQNGDLALLDALHARLRRCGGTGVALEMPEPELDPTNAVGVLAGALEAHWSLASDHPTLRFVAARAPQTPIAVVSAPHEASEARAVVRAVIDALAGGAAIDRIAIVPIELAEPTLEPLRGELSAARLPFSEPRGRPANAAPEAHAALELMRLAEGPIARDALVDVLRMPGLRLERLSGRSRQTRFIDRIQRLPVPVDRTGKELLAALRAERERVGADSAVRTDLDVAEATLSSLCSQLERLRGPHTRLRFRDEWLKFFVDLGLLTSSAAALGHALEHSGAGEFAPLRALSDNALAGRAIEDALERVARGAALLGLGAESIELAALSEEFAGALSGMGRSQGAWRAGALRIARPSEVAGLDLDLLVVCGAASSRLDRVAADSDGVLTQELLAALRQRIRPLRALESASFTRLALTSTLSRARQRVVTWAKRDAAGPSASGRFVDALIRAGAEARSEVASALDPRARRATPLAPASAEVLRRAEIEGLRAAFFLDPRSLPDAWSGLTGSLSEYAGGDAEHPLALTKLERYARCGFLGFANIVLRAVREDAVGDALSARERGTLIHDALARALEGTREHWGSRPLAELEREANERARAHLMAHAASLLRGAALEAAHNDARSLIRWSFSHAAGEHGSFFAEAERAFGRGSEWQPLAIGTHFVSGRIDRIDCNADRSVACVIDYKTGPKPSGAALEHELLQPWLYALKVAREYAASSVSSGYLTLNRRSPSFKAVHDGPAEGAAMSAKLEQAQALLEALAAGIAVPRPHNPAVCARCEARDICRRPLSAPVEDSE